MGVYISGMKMPKSCADCPCASIFAGYKCMVCARQFDKYPLENRMDWCPLIPVPPHGRCVDADELLEHAWRNKLDSRKLIAGMIDSAPTVIPAEKE